jgi:hypothetical protein
MSNIRFKIFVPDRSAFLKLWGNRVKPTDNVVIEYKTPDQMEAEYRTCHYGMILRDDIVVNNVACPTKLVEYLQYGIVPVCKSEKIGDFAELGMHYVKHTEFVAKSLPTNAERDEIARQNYSVLNCLYATYVDGKTALLNVLSEN